MTLNYKKRSVRDCNGNPFLLRWNKWRGDKKDCSGKPDPRFFIEGHAQLQNIIILGVSVSSTSQIKSKFNGTKEAIPVVNPPKPISFHAKPVSFSTKLIVFHPKFMTYLSSFPSFHRKPEPFEQKLIKFI